MDDDQDETVGLTEAVRKKVSESQAKSATDASSAGHAISEAGPNDDNLAGFELAGRYVLAEKILEDETYMTFRAEHKTINRRVNVKLLRAHLSQDCDATAAFQLLVQEQTAGRQTDPAGLCADFGVAANGRPYAVYIPASGSAAQEPSVDETQDLAETIRREIQEAKGSRDT